MSDNKPLILSSEIVKMLRGECGYTESVKDIAELAISYYQDGKAGQPFAAEAFSGIPFSAEIKKRMIRFLRACWQQGQNDVEKEQTYEN